MSIIDVFIVWGFIALLGWAAVSDYRDYLIPNRVCLAIVGLYPAHVFASPVPVDWMSAASVASAVLAVGFIVFALGLAGAGDAKLLASVMLWAGSEHLVGALLITGISGGLLSLLAIVRLRQSMPQTADGVGFGHWLGVAIKARVSYGVGISIGGLYVAGQILAA